MVNVQIIFLFIILMALSVGSAIGSFIRTHSFGQQMWYLYLSEQGHAVRVFVEDILTFIILCACFETGRGAELTRLVRRQQHHPHFVRSPFSLSII